MKLLVNGKPLGQEESSNLYVGTDRYGTRYVECLDNRRHDEEQKKLTKLLQRSRY